MLTKPQLKTLAEYSVYAERSNESDWSTSFGIKLAFENLCGKELTKTDLEFTFKTAVTFRQIFNISDEKAYEEVFTQRFPDFLNEQQEKEKIKELKGSGFITPVSTK